MTVSFHLWQWSNGQHRRQHGAELSNTSSAAQDRGSLHWVTLRSVPASPFTARKTGSGPEPLSVFLSVICSYAGAQQHPCIAVSLPPRWCSSRRRLSGSSALPGEAGWGQQGDLLPGLAGASSERDPPAKGVSSSHSLSPEHGKIEKPGCGPCHPQTAMSQADLSPAARTSTSPSNAHDFGWQLF